MALIASGTHGSRPGMTYEFYADQTGGNGNNRTIKLTLKLKCGGSTASSWYGFPVNWRGHVNGTWSGWMAVKGTESWNGTNSFREYAWTHTTNVGTTAAKVITVGFETDSYSGDDTWDLTKTGNFTVGITNTAPYFASGSYLTFREGTTSTGTIITNAAAGTENSKVVRETLDNVYISWPAAKDNDGDAITYEVWNQQNDGAWSKLTDTKSTNYTHNIGSGNEGRSYDYYVKAKDSKGAYSANLDGTQFIKNKFTMDTLTSTSNIAYGSSTLTFTYSGGNNTQAGVTTTRKLTCDNGITVYNNTITASPITVTIYRSGTLPTGAYIKFEDLKTKFGTSTLKGIGTLTFTLTATNSNGTVKTSTKTININLQTDPKAVTGQQISTVQTESTAYLTVGTTTNKYFIPDGSKIIRIKWSTTTGNLGEPVKYALYVAYGSGGYEKITDLPTGSSYYNHVLPKQTESRQFKYKIVTISTYNETLINEAITTAQTLHYYNEPGITQGTITRAATTADVIVTVKTNTSIPNVNTKGSWAVYNQGTTSPVISSGTLTAAQVAQTLKITGLTDAGKYDLKITYNDDTGFTTTNKVSPIISIGANSPIFFVNKYGVGVNGEQATSSQSLRVKGGAYVNGTLNATNLTVGSNNVYHTGRKPSPADIGATTLTEVKKMILDSFYPVGSIYISVNSTNPGTTMGGTWVAWGSGRVPVGVNSADTKFNTVEKTGGNQSQSLRALIGAVGNNKSALGYNAVGPVTGKGYTSTYGVAGNAISANANVNHSTEVLQADGNIPTTLQPYITCYMWKRTV